MKRLIDWIKNNVIARNVLAAVAGFILLGFLSTVLLNILTRHNRYIEVPQFKGLNIDEAHKLAHKTGLKIEINDSLYVPAYDGGTVLEQTPSEGTQVKSGRRIFFTINSFGQKKVRIPYVTGYSLRQAKNNLEIAGLEIDKLIFKPDIANNYVLEERYQGREILPRSTTEAEMGSGITLIVGQSADAPAQVIPKLIGFPLREAKSRIWEAGMNVGKVEFDPEIDLLSRLSARVYYQSPGQSVRAAQGTTINLKLTLDDKKLDKESAASDRSAKVQAARDQQADESAATQP